MAVPIYVGLTQACPSDVYTASDFSCFRGSRDRSGSPQADHDMPPDLLVAIIMISVCSYNIIIMCVCMSMKQYTIID